MRAMSRSMTRSAGAMSLAITLSRLAGLLRDQVIAGCFPPGATDAFWAAFRIPNMLRELLAEGSLNAAFVPVYTEVREQQGKPSAFRLANCVLSVLMVVTGLFGLSIVLFSRAYVLSISSGFDPSKVDAAATIAQFLSPFLFFLSIAAVLMGMANVRGEYFVPSVASAGFNVAMVLSAVLLAPVCERAGLPGVTSLAIGSVLGGALQLAIQLPATHRDGFRFKFMLDSVGGASRKILMRMAPAVVGVAGTFINTLVDGQVASHYGDGPMSYLVYAFRIWLLPVGLFGVAISTVNLTQVSRDRARGDSAGFRSTLGASIRMTLVLTIPAAVGLMLLAQPIVRVLYQHGKFGPEATQATGLLLCLYSIGLPAYALIKLYVPTLYTLGRSWLPVSVSLAMIGAKVLINVMSWRAGWSYSWLALTTGLAACANAAITSLLLRREIGSLAQERIASTTFKTLVGSAAMALACWVTGWGMSLALPGDALIPSIVRLMLQILVGLAVLFPLMAQLGVGEAQQLLGIGKRMLARVTGRAS